MLDVLLIYLYILRVEFPTLFLEFILADKTPPIVVTDAERRIVLAALQLQLKSHERAVRATTGAISAAHDAESAAVRLLINKVSTGALL